MTKVEIKEVARRIVAMRVSRYEKPSDLNTRRSVIRKKVETTPANRQAAINWIINNQFGRRNLHPDQASYLRGKRYNTEKQDKGGDRKSKGQNDPLIESTADRLADEYQVSEKTIKRDGQFAAAIDVLAAVGIEKPGSHRVLIPISGFP